MTYKTALVVGAGAFGTSVASVLANNFQKVILLVRSQDVYNALKKDKENKVYLPGHKLKDNIVPALNWEEVDELSKEGPELLVSGLPTQAIKTYFTENKERFNKYLDRNIPLVSLSKGIDVDTLELPDDIFGSVLPGHSEKIMYLSGPSYAEEILEEQITLVALGGKSKKNLELVADMLDTSYFKVMLNYDVKGVLLGGALKNLLAISGGILEGLGFNHNTRAAMITRGINEMLRFGLVYNARPETFYGLSGMGDLILTVTGNLSRNKAFGIELAKGRKAKEILESQRYVVEGYKTTEAAYKIALKYDITARMTHGLYGVLYEDQSPLEVIKNLMKVPTRFEVGG
ncbi:MAG: NAD(P)H-dependent glycerol-3-phosphate dehydrogenase [Bacteriovoracaceae bacterium]